ncbi:hypothetical protein HN695_04705 [Candidatus Woesearchaeota archaeon]|nr:hypothetical protein [Candidatus Woesearchaeota archaeon]MBT5271877.1 hypothetical protein [Candidatus Woesearchaeota archaeon]MBT6041659.1 hypothetical protein [Candidatus Woesearchaeota archaeon]MBT6337365.1 hypothetical protein [Candidatus Woesearchaeota archaeon]MBT7927613.1 hypothetical protein [Candidatus Woesearchaeota archaeon]
MNFKKQNKKAQGLSLNTVASAVIVLVVIIVIIIIFTGKASLFSGSVSACDSKPGAKCVPETECPKKADNVFYSQKLDFKCGDKDLVCCYSQCKAISGKCEQKCKPDDDDVGPADCIDGETCCK